MAALFYSFLNNVQEIFHVSPNRKNRAFKFHFSVNSDMPRIESS